VYDWKTELPGIFSRHADTCPVRDGLECTCGPLGYRASIRDWETNRRTVSPMFESVHEAVAWQRDQMTSRQSAAGLALDRGELGALIDEFLQAAEDGMARDTGGAQYTRDSVRALRGALSYVDSELGTMDVQDVRRRHIQALLDQLRGSGLPPVRLAAIVDALNALYGYAIRHEVVGFSPVVELQLPEPTNGAVAEATANPKAAQTAATGQWTTGELWTAPPQVGDPWTPPPFAPGRHNGDIPTPPAGYPYPDVPTPPSGYAYGGYPTPPPGATYGYPTPYPVQQAPTRSGPLSAIMGSPGTVADANYDATMQERWLWWTVRIIVIVFVLIALVLVAESV
jgi:hypothetical protein